MQEPPDTRIIYVFAVTDFDPALATPLQGFAPSLCRHSWLLRILHSMPSDFAEFAIQDNDVRIARRIAGEGSIWWCPLSSEVIERLQTNEPLPIIVVLVPPSDSAQRYMKWKSGNKPTALIVAETGGDVDFANFSREYLRWHCQKAIQSFSSSWDSEFRDSVNAMLKEWCIAEGRSIGYTIGGHNAFTPNVAALLRAGFDNFVEGRFSPDAFGIEPYVREIKRTAISVLDERQRIGSRDINRYHPLQPDLILFAPSLYSEYRGAPGPRSNDHPRTRQTRKAVQMLTSQRGYSFEGTVTALKDAGLGFSDGKANVHPIFQLRQQELFLNTEAISLMAASELSAVIRLPNDINRTAGQVRQFAAQQRGTNNRDNKRVKAFRDVQTRLSAAVPTEFIDLIRRSKSGIRIVSDAPLEWLDVDGVPLGIGYNTSRIPTTPGNSFIEELVPRPRIRLRPEIFQDVLIINALDQKDPIAPLFPAALEVYDDIFRSQINVRQREVGSKKEFVDAINSFGGGFMIFNGHGSHAPDEPACLWLKNEKVDVWDLKQEINRPSPIVLLSACDTHAADRNHATTAMGFLSLGSITVLATFVPILAIDAAVFSCRLLHRVAEFIPAVVEGFDRAVTWPEVVGGMLRMTLLRDFIGQLREKNLLDDPAYLDLNKQGNLWINGGTSKPFDLVLGSLIERGIPEAQARSEFKRAIATSSAISYVQVGRPELLVFDTPERIEKQFTEAAMTIDAAAKKASGLEGSV